RVLTKGGRGSKTETTVRRAGDRAVDGQDIRFAVLVNQQFLGIFQGTIFATIGNHYDSLHAYQLGFAITFGEYAEMDANAVSAIFLNLVQEVFQFFYRVPNAQRICPAKTLGVGCPTLLFVSGGQGVFFVFTYMAPGIY